MWKVCEEWWPVVFLSNDPEDATETNRVRISPNELADYRDTVRRFAEWQKRLGNDDAAWIDHLLDGAGATEA